MDWNCTETDKRLSDYLERLTSPEETEAFSAHIERCPECAALVAQVSGTIRLMREAEPAEVPPQLFAKIINATSGARQPARGWRRWMPAAPLAWQPQFAMGALTVAASFLIVFHAASTSHNPQNFATLNPVNLYRAANRQAHLTYAHTAKFVNDMRFVYEIESRLEPDQEQQPEPAIVPPAQTPGSNSQPGASQPKTEERPHSGARTDHPRGLYALAEPWSIGGRSFSADIEPAFASGVLTHEVLTSPESANFYASATAEDTHFSATRSRS